MSVAFFFRELNGVRKSFKKGLMYETKRLEYRFFSLIIFPLVGKKATSAGKK